MARPGQTNMIEQHLEKGILALCALGLAFVAFHWVLSSPRQIADAPPSKVDDAMLAKAHETQSIIEDFKPKDEPVPDYAGKIRVLQSPSPPKPWTLYSVFQKPIADEPMLQGAKVKLSDLIDVLPKPGKPMVKAEPELPEKPMDNPSDIMTAHVVAVFPWTQLQEAWRAKLRDVGLPFVPVVLGVEAEVQEQLSNGQWGPARPVQTVTMPLTDTQGAITTVPEMPAYNGTNATAIDELRRLVSDPGSNWQQYFLQPPYWRIWWPGYGWVDWQVNLPKTEVSIRAAETTGGQPGSAAPVSTPTAMPVRPGGGSTPGVAGARPAAGRGMRPEDRFQDVADIQSPRPAQRQVPARNVRPEDRFRDVGDIESPRTAQRQVPARNVRREDRFQDVGDVGSGRPAGRLGVIPGQGAVSPGGLAAVQEPIVPPEPTAVPPLLDQMQQGQVLVWFHENSLESTKVYHYRLRLKLLNPLLAFETSVTDPNDAAVPGVVTPWSEWSDPVAVPQATEFFLVGSFPAQGSVRVAVFSRALGQQVMETFSVVQGQSIGQSKEIELAHPAQEGKVSKVPVDFATGAIAVEFDFSKSVGVRRTAVEMLYLDERGQLRRMVDVRALSKTDPEYKHYTDLVDKTKISRRAAGAAAEAAEAAQPAPPAAGARTNF